MSAATDSRTPSVVRLTDLVAWIAGAPDAVQLAVGVDIAGRYFPYERVRIMELAQVRQEELASE